MYFIVGANVEDSLTTGMGRQMHGLGDALASRGHRVDYLFSGGMGLRLGRKLARFEAPLRTAIAIDKLAKRSTEVPIAILHEPIAWPTALRLRRRVRTLAMVHACETRCWRVQVETRNATGEQISPSSRVVWPLTELTQAFASLKTSAGVLCLSTQDREYMVDSLAIPAERIARIDNGLEPRFIGVPLTEKPPERDLLFLGSWLPRKGTKILIAALERLSALGVSAKLTLAGTGPTESIIRDALPAAWRETTEIVPHVRPEGLIDVYRRHRILLLPSVAEGIPLVVLEAMACGLCPIVTAVGGSPDVISSGTDGILVPMLDSEALAQATIRALREPEETRRMGKNAHAKMQAYSWSRVAQQLEHFLDVRFGAAR
ncbi:MAG TPA: glycosyltransferase family 4 protein [Polyangia bacterium]